MQPSVFHRTCLSVLGGLSLSSLSMAATVVNYWMEANHDNFVFQASNPNTVVQSPQATTLLSKFYTDTNSRNIYMKFDVPDYLASGQDATFRIYSAGPNSYNGSEYATWNFQLYGLMAGAAGYDWTESSLSVAIAPAYVARNKPDAEWTTYLGSFNQAAVSAADAYYEVSFSALEQLVQADGTVTLILLTNTQSSATPSFSFASSEHTTLTGPALFWTVPEPTKATFLLMGLAFVILRRKRY